MALVVSTNDFLLSTPILKWGSFLNPNNIGDNATLPSNFFTGDKLGNVVGDSINIQLPKSFAEAKEGITKRLLRKDVIEQMFIVEADIYNFRAEQMGIFMGRRTQLNYAITVPSPGNVDIVHFGTAAPCPSAGGLSMPFVDVSCPSRQCEVNMYYAILTAEDQGIQFGDTYPLMHIKFEGTPHPSFGDTGTDPQDNLGNFWRQVA